MKVIKRDGQIVEFDAKKIEAAIGKANTEVKPRERANKEETKEVIVYINGRQEQNLTC